MLRSNAKSVVLTLLCVAFASLSSGLQYQDLEFLGITCPLRDSCHGYKNNLSYVHRSCECDSLCVSYGDCCIDAPAKNRSSAQQQSSLRSNLKCLNYGGNEQTGVYAISKCSRNWNGPREVRRKCTGPVDFRDPMTASPVTDVELSVTYRNLFCAECNNANMASLKTFQLNFACGSLVQLTEAQILADLTYNQRLKIWGVNRLNRFGNGTDFFGCSIIYDVPGYLNSSVRFCRSNLISNCAQGWNRPTVREACKEYMAVVYEDVVAYRNPHCAICNHRTVNDVTCRTDLLPRKRPMSFALLLDVNQSDGDQVGMRRVATPQCPSGHKYDPFFKRCRQLVCALPGHVVVDGKCVRG